jgi:WS/DGAT/MGAT family acyltransferase
MTPWIESQPMSNVDTAWVRMEKPHSMAMIAGVFFFDEPLEFEPLKALIETRLLIYNRFRQVPVKDRLSGRLRWETDRSFDMNYHVRKLQLPPPGDLQALQTVTGELLSTQLDFTRPLWQIHVVEEYTQGGAMIVRLHHCIADGIALVQVLLSMTTPTPETPWYRPAQPPPPRRSYSVIGSAARMANRTRRSTQELLRSGMHLIQDPEKLKDVFNIGAACSLALNKLLMLGPDHPTLLRGKNGLEKRAAWSAPFPLEDVKRISKAMKGTVNDVLLAALAGGLGRYLEGRGESIAGVNIRSLVPINLRPPEETGGLGNYFGLVFLALPVGIKDPIRRLRVLKQRMDEIKDSPEAIVALGILNLIGLMPAALEEVFLRVFSMKASVVMTNVPGPKETLYLAGKPIRGIMFWVPSPAELGMGLSIISYAGEVIVGVASDANLVPDPETVVKGFQDELTSMKEKALAER